MEKHLRRLQEHQPAQFLAVAWLLSLFPSLLAEQLPAPPGIDPSHASKLSTAGLAWVAIVIAPVCETILIQFPLASLAQRQHLEGIRRLALVTLPFSLLHFMLEAPLPSIANGFGGGLILALCYVICQRRSHAYAILMTALLHALHNAAIFVMHV